MSKLLRALGVILILGGLGHSAGVTHFYLTQGVPDMSRVLLDVWVAEAHVLAGAFYFASSRAMRRGSSWRHLGLAGSLTILGYAVPFIPVLLVRAPVIFGIPPIVYAALSMFILSRAAAPDGQPSADRRGAAV